MECFSAQTIQKMIEEEIIRRCQGKLLFLVYRNKKEGRIAAVKELGTFKKIFINFMHNEEDDYYKFLIKFQGDAYDKIIEKIPSLKDLIGDVIELNGDERKEIIAVSSLEELPNDVAEYLLLKNLNS